MVDEPQQLAVVIEVGSAEPAQWVDAPAAGVVPWTEDQVAARGGDGQKTFDCGMRIPAVEPAAVAVDGRSRRLHVTPIIVRADQVDAARLDRCTDRLEPGVRLATIGIRGGYVVPERQ